MMKIFLLTMFMFSSFLMFTIKNPLNMGLLILKQTLIICLILNFNLNFYWLSYILFLIMIGGILILFMYMCSIAANEIIKFNINKYIIMLILLSLILIIMMKINLNWININILNFNNFNLFIPLEKLNMSKVYNNYTMFISIFLIIYLFIMLFMVTLMINSNKGPLRKFMSS